MPKRAMWALVLMTGCGFCGDDEISGREADEPAAREPAPPPDDLVFEMSLGGTETLVELRSLFRRHPLRAMVPESPAELIERLTDSQLDVGERIAADAPIFAVGVEAGYAIAVRVGVEPDRAHPLGPTVVVIPGAPEGGRFIGRAPDPTGDEPVALLVDDVLVVGENAEALRSAAAYLAFTLVPGGADAGLSLRLDEDVGQTARQMLDALLSREAEASREAAREERARSDEPPNFGEPEAVIAHGTRFLSVFLSFLPDLGAISGHLSVEDGVATLTLDADVREGSPLARRLSETEPGDTSELEALPANTAFAWSIRAPSEEASLFSFSEAFTDVAGNRLDTRGRAAVDAFAASWDTAHRDETIFAAGGGVDDAWIAAVLPRPRAELADSALGAVVGTRYLATLFGLVFECDRPPRPRVGAPICPGAPAIFSTRSDTNAAVGLARDLALGESLSGSPAARLGAEPDVSRALHALGDALVMSIVLLPSRVMPLAGLSGSESLTRISRFSALAARPAPIALGVSRSEGRLRVTVHASGGAIEDAVTLFGSL